MSTRDARQIASHAQKFFIKLALTGQLLPSKVAESGCGYTLSGKPLDPESAAAKAYGFREGMLQGECSASLLPKSTLNLYTKPCTHQKLASGDGHAASHFLPRFHDTASGRGAWGIH